MFYKMKKKLQIFKVDFKLFNKLNNSQFYNMSESELIKQGFYFV